MWRHLRPILHILSIKTTNARGADARSYLSHDSPSVTGVRSHSVSHNSVSLELPSSRPIFLRFLLPIHLMSSLSPRNFPTASKFFSTAAAWSVCISAGTDCADGFEVDGSCWRVSRRSRWFRKRVINVIDNGSVSWNLVAIFGMNCRGVLLRYFIVLAVSLSFNVCLFVFLFYFVFNLGSNSIKVLLSV